MCFTQQNMLKMCVGGGGGLERGTGVEGWLVPDLEEPVFVCHLIQGIHADPGRGGPTMQQLICNTNMWG